MSGPLPIPKRFPCPYCDEQARLCKFDTDTSLAYYSHKIEKTVKVGQVSHIILHTIHYFSTAWYDEKWWVVNRRLGSSKICENVAPTSLTGWKSCDREE